MKCLVSKWNDKEGNQLVADGLIRINPNKQRFGSIMLIATDFVLNNGFMNLKRKVGFIVGEVSALKTLINKFGLKDGTDYSEAVIPHRIVVIEKLESETPENMGFQKKINPSTQELLLKNGEQIWWRTQVVDEDNELRDILIQHDRTAPAMIGDGKQHLFADSDLIAFKVEGKVDLSVKKK